MNTPIRILAVLLIIFHGPSTSAQSAHERLRSLVNSDSSSARLLFSYPDSIRQAAFTAATYPEGLTQLSEIQKQSAADFRKMAEPFNRTRQKQLWEISRHPGLAARLIALRGKSSKSINESLKDLPDETRKAASYFARKKPETLQNMESIRTKFESGYRAQADRFPANVRESYHRLVAHPDLLTLLTSDMRTVRTVGEVQQSNPALLKQVADSVHAQVAKEGGEEFEAWKKGIESDPEIQKELKAVAKKYADDNVDDVYLDRGEKRRRDVARVADTSRVVRTPAPYPYWAGYPYWYPFPVWRPYPWYWHSGFYWDPWGSMVFMGMPSYHFGWWYYNHPQYYRQYRRTSDYLDRHYHNYPRSNGGMQRSNREMSRPSLPRGQSSGGRSGSPRR